MWSGSVAPLVRRATSDESSGAVGLSSAHRWIIERESAVVFEAKEVRGFFDSVCHESTLGCSGEDHPALAAPILGAVDQRLSFGSGRCGEKHERGNHAICASGNRLYWLALEQLVPREPESTLAGKWVPIGASGIVARRFVLDLLCPSSTRRLFRMGTQKKRDKKSGKVGGIKIPGRVAIGPAPPTGTAKIPSLPDDKGKLRPLLKRIETLRERRVIAYATSPMAKMSLAAEVPLYDQLSSMGKQEAIDLLLITNGGDTEAPIRLVSLLREFSGQLSVLIPHLALSSGTLVALGADEIVMTPLAALGPIDPSRIHPLLPKREGAENPEPVSVQDMRHAMHFIREAGGEAGGEGSAYSPEAMAQIFTALFDKVHPLAIGAIEQSYALAKLIGRNCLSTHMDPKADNTKIDKIIDQLCDEYKSHSYRISRAEAKAIGLKVVEPDADLEQAMMDYYRFQASRPLGPFGMNLTPGSNVQFQIAWMDSTSMSLRVVQDSQVLQNNELRNQGDAWRPY